MIREEDVIEFQNKWANGIIGISKTFTNHGDYVNEARKFISNLYAYDSEKVLFKPTLAADTQFRLDKVSALSYFVGGNPDFIEDSGFAIKGWDSIKWENAGVIIINDCALCMGNYYFGMNNERDLKVEYSIVVKLIEGVLKIILHDSHFPYQK